MTRDRLRRTAGRWALSLVALAVAAIWAFPVYWMVNSSLMSNARLRSGTPSFWPVNATFSNYAAVIGGSSFTSALRMSLAITAVTVVAVAKVRPDLVYALRGLRQREAVSQVATAGGAA